MAGDLKGLGDLLSGGRVNLPTPRPPEIPKDKRKKNVRFATLPEDAHPIDHLYNNREGEFEEAEYFRELAKAKAQRAADKAQRKADKKAQREANYAAKAEKKQQKFELKKRKLLIKAKKQERPSAVLVFGAWLGRTFTFKRILLMTTVLLILGGLAWGSIIYVVPIITGKPRGLLYTSHFAGFTTYYPSSELIKPPYVFDAKKVQYRENVVVFPINGLAGGRYIAVTEQAMPNDFEVSKLFTQAQEFTLGIGTMYIESTSQYSRAAIVTKKTLIIFNYDGQTSVDSLLNAGKTLREY